MSNTNATTTTTTTKPSVPTDYSYIKVIKTPSELGMSDKGDLKTIEKDVNGLIAYVKLLVDGPSEASKQNKGPLGNQFFASTGATCNVKMNGITTSVPRSIYVDNIPKGGIDAPPGANLPDFRGLIPGMMSGMKVLDPNRIAESIANSNTPDCIQVTLNVVDSSFNIVPETNYITVSDARHIDPCSFTKNVNPVTNVKCSGKEGFVSGIDASDLIRKPTHSELLFSEIENDITSQLFMTSFGVLGIYLLHLLLKNRFK